MKKQNKSAYSVEELSAMFLEQPICCHSKPLAKWLAKNGATAEEVDTGVKVTTEGDGKNRDVFCVVSGQLDILIGGHLVTQRLKGTHVGEMAMIMNEARTASAVAARKTLLLRIPEKVMKKAYEKFPQMWEPVAKTLCERLHERRKFFRVKNEFPKVFIGSSGARRYVADALKAELVTQIQGEVRVWAEDSIFAPSSNTLQALIDQAKQCDFGIFVFGADDKVNSKGRRYSAPRDNVVFEGGMFTGTCGICRTIFLCENHERLKMPSDLNGVTYLNFTLEGRAKLPRFGTSINRIAALIHKLKTV